MIYLASQSPRRRDLLEQINVDFKVISAEVDESINENELGLDYCLRVAIAKAQAGWHCAQRVENLPVLGADTTVLLNDEILTKPNNKEHAGQMLSKLSNKTHQVVTSVAIVFNDKITHATSITDVNFTFMSEHKIKNYVNSGESMGRAGSYSIQGQISKYIKHISGSYSGVVGLPLYETAQLLRQI